MLFIFSPFQSPYANVALEHYLIHNFKDEFLILYINHKSVIIGKHQNAFAEANFNFIKKNNIPIVRRISGGGAVYHDEGNLNIAIIKNNSKINISDLIVPILKFLETIGIYAVQNTKNDILIKNKKITGTAAHIFKNRSLYHSTLLVNASLDYLKEALKSEKDKFLSKSIASKPSPVTNLIFELNYIFTFDDVVSAIKKYLCEYFNIKSDYHLSDNDIYFIENLVKTKFSTWQWNYGYSPAFVYKDNINQIAIECRVVNGIIESCNFNYDINDKNFIGKKFDLPFVDLLFSK